LKDLQGNLVVVNFWATWCVPCREEIPMLVRFAKENAAPGLMFIAVSVDDRETLNKVGGPPGSSELRFRYGWAQM
jgi:thiol-disulfide isomerase/thioredoxin